MPDTRILIVDDNTELQGLLARMLGQEGWVSFAALSLGAGEQLLTLHQPQVVLLDVMLGDGSGLEACPRWRLLVPEVAILMLSARSDPMDRVRGLEVGADDYLAKPFEKRELIARVRALLRRHRAAAVPTPTPNPTPGGVMQLDEIVIDMGRCEAVVGGRVVALTAIEYKMLVTLARTPGQTQSREVLQAAVQPGNYRPLDRTVDVQVGRLRRKLQDAAPGRDWITTVRGEGYAFAPNSVPP